MRKITSKSKEKTKQLIVGGILIFIMFGSVFGIIVSSFGKKDSLKKINYNGFEFTEQNGFWFTKNGNLNFVFEYNPNEVAKIDSELKSLENYYNKPLYIFSQNKEAEREIYKNLNQVVLRMQSACFEEKTCDKNWPVKTCENNFIIIKESNVTSITQNQSCVFIQSTQEDLLKITDEFLFKILGIE